MLLIGLVGCATIPNGGYHGDISQLGIAGDVLATVNLGEGLLVGTANLDKNRSVNLQINKEDVPDGGSWSTPTGLTMCGSPAVSI